MYLDIPGTQCTCLHTPGPSQTSIKTVTGAPGECRDVHDMTGALTARFTKPLAHGLVAG